MGQNLMKFPSGILYNVYLRVVIETGKDAGSYSAF